MCEAETHPDRSIEGVSDTVSLKRLKGRSDKSPETGVTSEDVTLSELTAPLLTPLSVQPNANPININSELCHYPDSVYDANVSITPLTTLEPVSGSNFRSDNISQSCNLSSEALTGTECDEVNVTDGNTRVTTEVLAHPEADDTIATLAESIWNGTTEYSPPEDPVTSGQPTKGKKIFHCFHYDCNLTFPKHALLKYHIEKYHKKIKWHTCVYKGCGKSFYHVSQMMRHLRVHRPKAYFCSLCYQFYSTKYNLQVHQKKCRLVLICSVCGSTFLTQSDINRHRQMHCVYVKCVYSDCPEKLTPELIYDHLISHVSTFRCPLCTLLFAESANLETHVIKDHKAEFVAGDYDCDIDFETWFKNFCGPIEDENDIYVVENVNNVESDGSSSTQATTKKVQSSYIPKKQGEQNKKKNLKLVEKGNESTLYRCNECEYSTSNPRWLTKHTLKHRNAKSLVCKECKVTFSDKWSLKLHSAKHSSNQKIFACQYCNLKFVSQSRLSEHCQNAHPQSRIWCCKECNQKFTTNRRLLMHYKRHITDENK